MTITKYMICTADNFYSKTGYLDVMGPYDSLEAANIEAKKMGIAEWRIITKSRFNDIRKRFGWRPELKPVSWQNL